MEETKCRQFCWTPCISVNSSLKGLKKMSTTEKILQTMSSWHWGELIVECGWQGLVGSSRPNVHQIFLPPDCCLLRVSRCWCYVGVQEMCHVYCIPRARGHLASLPITNMLQFSAFLYSGSLFTHTGSADSTAHSGQNKYLEIQIRWKRYILQHNMASPNLTREWGNNSDAE